MPQGLLRFSFVFLGILAGSYFIHFWVIELLSLIRSTSIINLSYIFNGVFTLFLAATITVLRKKYKDQIGFIFLVGSFVKLGLFVVVIKLYGFEMSKSVFLDFFVSYVISLVIEVYYVAKILNPIK